MLVKKTLADSLMPFFLYIFVFALIYQVIYRIEYFVENMFLQCGLFLY